MLSVSCGAEVGGRPGERKRGEEYGEDKGFRGRIKKMKQMRGGKAKTNRTGEEKKKHHLIPKQQQSETLCTSPPQLLPQVKFSLVKLDDIKKTKAFLAAL